MSLFSDRSEIKWETYTSPTAQHVTLGENVPECTVLRLDLIRSWASGNKYFKLKYVLQDAVARGISTIVSKGGMFSNHLAALSEACKVFNIRLIAVIRSYAPDEMNPSVCRLRANGNEIMYLHPQDYKSYGHEESGKIFPDALFIPEGGLSHSGIRGTAEIASECMQYNPTHVVLAGGTMGTACGLLASLPSTVNLIIVPAWKGCKDAYMHELLERFQIDPKGHWTIWPDFHFGGFGKYDFRLVDYMSSSYRTTGIPLDPVYTGKMMFALDQMVQEGSFKKADRIVAIHTGGLQGLDGYQYSFPEVWSEYVNGIKQA